MPKGLRGFQKGHKINFGKKNTLGHRWKMSEQGKENISLAHTGEKNFWFGKVRSEETKRKIGEANKISLRGYKHTKETCTKMGESKRGTHLSESLKLKLSLIHMGDKNPQWKGGHTIIYAPGWTRTFRNKIRERDNYTCQVCGEKQGKMLLDIHHIDYNKLNSNPDNLIALCRKCHIATNSNRNYWEQKIKKIKLWHQ